MFKLLLKRPRIVVASLLAMVFAFEDVSPVLAEHQGQHYPEKGLGINSTVHRQRP